MHVFVVIRMRMNLLPETYLLGLALLGSRVGMHSPSVLERGEALEVFPREIRQSCLLAIHAECCWLNSRTREHTPISSCCTDHL